MNSYTEAERRALHWLTIQCVSPDSFTATHAVEMLALLNRLGADRMVRFDALAERAAVHAQMAGPGTASEGFSILDALAAEAP